MPTPAAGGGLEQDVARTRDALGITATHRALTAAAGDPRDPGDPSQAAGEDAPSAVTPLAYTAAGRIREGSVRPRVSIVV